VPPDHHAGQPAPRRLLLFAYHAGYLRHYRDALRLLAAQGHTIHLAFTVIEKDAGDRVLAEELAADFPGSITFGEAPTRSRRDGWRRTATLVRAFLDLARYIDPRYDDASALRTRMAEKIKRHILSGRADAATSYLLTRIVDRLARSSDLRLGRRIQRVLTAAEDAIPTSSRIDRFIAAWQPDTVIVTPLVDFASVQVEFLKSARRLGVPTTVAVASWDNLTNKGLLRFVPDRVLIWNEIQRRELVELHGVPAERAVVTGAAKFDAWFDMQPSRTADELAAETGLEPGRPYVLYVCSSPFIAPDEVSFVERYVRSLRASEATGVRDLQVLVRPHPQNTQQWQDVDLSELGVAIWPRGGEHPDAAASRASFFDSIAHSVAVVGINTSAMIDSAIVGRNVLTILDPVFAATQEGTLHFHYLLREHGGFLEVAHSFAEHHAQLASILGAGAAEDERVQRFVESFVRPRGIALPVSPLLAEELLASADAPRVETAGGGVRRSAIRIALLLPTAFAGLTLAFGAAAEKLTRGRSTQARERRRRALKAQNAVGARETRRLSAAAARADAIESSNSVRNGDVPVAPGETGSAATASISSSTRGSAGSSRP
jgi:hypothetical protein